MRKANSLGCDNSVYGKLIDFFVSYLGGNSDSIKKVFLNEVSKFEKTLETGLKEFEDRKSHV